MRRVQPGLVLRPCRPERGDDAWQRNRGQGEVEHPIPGEVEGRLDLDDARREGPEVVGAAGNLLVEDGVVAPGGEIRVEDPARLERFAGPVTVGGIVERGGAHSEQGGASAGRAASVMMRYSDGNSLRWARSPVPPWITNRWRSWDPVTTGIPWRRCAAAFRSSARQPPRYRRCGPPGTRRRVTGGGGQ